ncbi:E3 ubiquitin/ISG15 ligase TRIM25-like [Mixophyes fleayi]|uniref:E3 ubiquitin/ISG15 ligase TRIM25-like n=1 Tax=Mixophyes fleayi TaxID=3061075 RepID=UPI003F4D8A5A
MSSADLREEMTCFICLKIYTDPVTLRCGHNFCRVCIDCVLDTQEGSGVYTCAKCRTEFQERPALHGNTTLCNIAQRYLSTQPEQEKTGIFCTYCIHSSVSAVKSCLMCEAYLCNNHLKIHSKSLEHVLAEPTTCLENRKCSAHNEILKYYCYDDDTCICVTCSLVGDHKGHEVDLLYEASVKMKEDMKSSLEKLNANRKKTEDKLQILQECRKKIPEKAADMKEKLLKLLRGTREQQVGLEERVLSDISSQEEQVSLSVSDLINLLENKKDKLTKEINHTDELCNITDPLSLLRGCESDVEMEDTEDREIGDEKIHSAGKLDDGLISETLHIILSDILTGINKDLYIQETKGMILDVNTASNNVLLSGDFKSASGTDIKQNLYENPERFIDYSQVLGNMCFSSGRHYWEVETNETEYLMIGMCYPSMDRKGRKSLIGVNNKSWGLTKQWSRYYVRHNSKDILLTPNFSAHRFRIYLDFEGGRLSFYELSDPIKHLHTFTATFTEGLYAVFCVWNHSWVRIRS